MESPVRVTPVLRRSTAPSRRRVDEARKDEVLLRLQDLIFAEGFLDATMAEMSSKIQCSKATLYAILPSKERLVVTVFKRHFDAASKRVLGAASKMDNPLDKITTHLAGVAAEMRRMSPDCCADMMSFEPTRELYDNAGLGTAKRVREYIQQGVDEGIFRPVRAEFVAETVSVLVDSIMYGELPGRTGLDAGDAYAELSDLVLAALLNKSAPYVDRR